MKTIAQLNGVDFLRRCNKVRHRVADILAETGVLEYRKRQPEFTGNESLAERNQLIRQQSKKNIDAMLDCLLEEHADKTVELLNLLTIREEGDPEELAGFDMLTAGLELFSNQKVMDFFISVASSGLKLTVN